MSETETLTAGELAILLYVDMSETGNTEPGDGTETTTEGGSNEKSDTLSCG